MAAKPGCDVLCRPSTCADRCRIAATCECRGQRDGHRLRDREGSMWYVVLAPNLDDARALAAQDPYHEHGIRDLEQVLEWDPRRAMRLEGPTVVELEAMARGDSRD